MHTDHFTTYGTGPFLFFIQNEMPDTRFLYHLEIVDHTHSIFCSVSLVQLYQPGTGIAVTTIRAILDLAAGNLIAISYFTFATIFGFLTFFAIDPETSRTCILFSNESPTEAAVHSTGCNQIRGNCSLFFSMRYCHDLNIRRCCDMFCAYS